MKSRIERVKDFNSKKSPFSIAINMPLPADVQKSIEQKALKIPANKFPKVELLFPLWEELLTYAKQNEVDDDSIDILYPNQYDQGICGAMFGAKMDFLIQPGWGFASSNSMPFDDKTLDELLKLEFDPNNAWLKRMKKDLAYFSQKNKGRFNVSTIITIDGFNFAHQIRGSKFFEEIYDCPDKLKELLSLAVDMNIKLVEFQRGATGESCRDGAYVLGGFFPNKTVAMSFDTYNMCSPAIYEEFGRPYQQLLIDHFGGGSFHLHGNGRHLLPEAAKLSGFVFVALGDDGAATRAFDDRKKIRKLAGNLLLGINCNKEELEKAIREGSLVPARYHVECSNKDEANHILEKFRNYRM